MVRCRACGHRWIESRAVAGHRCLAGAGWRPATRIPRAIAKSERLVEAAQLAREAFIANRRRKTAERRAWACFAAALLAPVIVALPSIPKRWCAPRPPQRGSMRRPGIKVNIYGLEVRRIAAAAYDHRRHRASSPSRARSSMSRDVDRKIPVACASACRTNARGEVYAWTLDSGDAAACGRAKRRPSPPASPRRREAAEKVEIRFARPMKSAQMPRHERHSY